MSPRFRALLLAALLAPACARDAEAPEAWALEGGGTIAARARADGPTVALVVDPGDFSRCFVPLSRWVEWEARHPGRLSLLLARAPTEGERRQLVRFRVRPDGVLAGAAGRKGPAELLFVDGRARYARVGSFGALTDALLTTGPGLDPARLALPPPLSTPSEAAPTTTLQPGETDDGREEEQAGRAGGRAGAGGGGRGDAGVEPRAGRGGIPLDRPQQRVPRRLQPADVQLSVLHLGAVGEGDER
ncbi:MAG TPA: hypothetical protein VHG91_18070 [Longimicrobium sp.]|nr:hypothetical protein [Longimicrobium sp.]